MNPDIVFRRAGADDAAEVAAMAGKLLNEIMDTFDRTLAFYVREGFTITGGPKLKRAL